MFVPLTFQSRNRGSFGFKFSILGQKAMVRFQFRSRNRGFSLQGGIFHMVMIVEFLFRSRNRGSFDFKYPQHSKLLEKSESQGFHLVIKVLLISRASECQIDRCQT